MSKGMDIKTFNIDKEAAMWGLLYGLRESMVDFLLTYVTDPESQATETLQFRWSWRNAPTLLEDRLEATLMFNMVPHFVSIKLTDVVSISTDSGMTVGTMYAYEKNTDKPKLRVIN